MARGVRMPMFAFAVPIVPVRAQLDPGTLERRTAGDERGARVVARAAAGASRTRL